MAAADRLGSGFEEDMQQASGGLADRDYFRTLAENAVGTIGWLQSHGVEFVMPVYYLGAGPTRIQPVGGGRTIVERLAVAARQSGVNIAYESAAARLVTREARIRGVEIESGASDATTIDADAVVLASGGFQGNAAMMRAYFGPRAESLKLISPGTGFDRGDGIRMAMAEGARVSGAWDGMHIEPVDPRSRHSAPVVLVYPYGIVVDRNGRRFFDEGSGLAHETWEVFARDIHFEREGHVAYAILDSRLFEIEGFERAIRSEVPPYQSPSIEGLAAQAGIPASSLRATIEAFNAAAAGDAARFDPTRCDGLAAAETLQPRNRTGRDR